MMGYYLIEDWKLELDRVIVAAILRFLQDFGQPDGVNISVVPDVHKRIITLSFNNITETYTFDELT
jgi:hypothetical protein